MLNILYGGTKSEMERLIADANAYAASIGQASDLTIDSFADIIQAVELIQEKQGIAGATQKEAATTIQGSLGMVKASWANLITGLANADADITDLVGKFVDSVKTAGKNLLPVIKTGLQGVGTLFKELLPEIFKMIPDLLAETLPDFLEVIDSTFRTTFPALIKVITDNLPLIIKTVFEAGKTIASTIVNAILDQLRESPVFRKIEQFFTTIWTNVKNSAVENFGNIWKAIKTAAQKIKTALQPVIDKLKEWFDSGEAADDISNVLTTTIDILCVAIEAIDRKSVV